MTRTVFVKNIIVQAAGLILSVGLFIWTFLDVFYGYIDCVFIRGGTLESCRFGIMKAFLVLVFIISAILIFVFCQKMIYEIRSRNI